MRLSAFLLLALDGNLVVTCTDHSHDGLQDGTQCNAAALDVQLVFLFDSTDRALLFEEKIHQLAYDITVEAELQRGRVEDAEPPEELEVVVALQPVFRYLGIQHRQVVV